MPFVHTEDHVPIVAGGTYYAMFTEHTPRTRIPSCRATAVRVMNPRVVGAAVGFDIAPHGAETIYLPIVIGIARGVFASEQTLLGLIEWAEGMQPWDLKPTGWKRGAEFNP